MELKITALKHLKMLFSLILMTALGLAFIVYYDLNNFKFLKIFSIPYLALFFIPTLYLHLNYTAKSNNKSFKIENKGITKIENGNTVFYEESEIEEIIIYGTANKIKNKAFSNTVFEHYFYTEIKLKHKESLFITCLFSKNIDEILYSKFKNTNIRKVKCFYPTI